MCKPSKEDGTMPIKILVNTAQPKQGGHSSTTWKCLIKWTYLRCIKFWKAWCPKATGQRITNHLDFHFVAQQVMIYIPEKNHKLQCAADVCIGKANQKNILNTLEGHNSLYSAQLKAGLTSDYSFLG